MNILPVNLLNFKSTSFNTAQEAKRRNEFNVTLPNNNVNISQEVLKAYYCPKIAFCGNNKSADTTQLTRDEINLLNDFVYKVTGKTLKKNTQTKSEMSDLLKSANEEGYTVAHKLVDEDLQLYIKATKKIPQKTRLDLLKMADKGGETVAHNLAYEDSNAYIKATKDFSKKDRLYLLKMADKSGETVAHNLASEDSKAYIKATKDFSKKDRLYLLKMADKSGKTVAHELAYKDAKAYLKATKDFSVKERLSLLKMENHIHETVCECLFISVKTEQNAI